MGGAGVVVDYTSTIAKIDVVKLKTRSRIIWGAHAAQIGLYTEMHFQIWCNVRTFVGSIYIRM